MASDLELGPVRACPDPVPLSRVDATQALGLDIAPPDPGDLVAGGGILVKDFDGDGDLDFVQSHENVPGLWLWRQGAEGFDVETLDAIKPGSLMATADGAGFLAGGPRLVAYDDEGQAGAVLFEAGAGLVRDAVSIPGLGIFVALASPSEDPADREDRLLGAASLGPAAMRHAFDVVPIDANDDGLRDLYVVNDNMGDPGQGNVLWRNTGGSLVDASAGCDCDLAHEGMGGAAGDIDGDGLDDLYIGAGTDNRLLLSQGDGHFVDATLALDADPVDGVGQMAWGVALFDQDNDGDLDIGSAQGDFGDGHANGSGPQRMSLLIQGEDGRFSERISLGDGLWRAIVSVDLNQDGVLDLVLTDVQGALTAWVSTGCTAAGWLAVQAPDGTRVRVEAGGRTWIRTVSHDGSFGGARPASAWFGLGEQQVVDRLVLSAPEHDAELRLEGPIEARRWLRWEPRE